MERLISVGDDLTYFTVGLKLNKLKRIGAYVKNLDVTSHCFLGFGSRSMRVMTLNKAFRFQIFYFSIHLWYFS